MVLRMTPVKMEVKFIVISMMRHAKKSFPTKPDEAKIRVIAKVVGKKMDSKSSENVVKGQEMECRFDQIKNGLYAVSGYHDNKEANDKLDVNWFRFSHRRLFSL